MLLVSLGAGILSGAIMLVWPEVVSGQNYPSKPIRLVTTAAGGGNDFIARIVAQGIAVPLGQQVVVDNRGGSFIPPQVVSQAPPDGYSLLFSSNSLWVIPLLQKTPYDIVADFSPIVMTTRSPNIVVVHPSLPVTSIKELIALAKAKPGVINYGSSGIGTSLHLAAELFKAQAQINIVHVPYKSTSLSLTDLLANQVQLMFTSIAGAAPHVKTGKLRALAITSIEPSALDPNLPTVAASGLPGYEVTPMEGILAPANTPTAIIRRLNQEIVRVVNQPEIKDKLLASGSEVVGSSPEQFAAAIKAEMNRMGKIIKDAGIRAN
jgi:tripartite-type tricarboxylate transporter receptor subunit TctC